MTRAPSRWFPAFALFSCLAMVAVPALAGTIAGRLFKAEDPDSVAAHVPVALIFRDANEELQRLSAMTDGEGHFHFTEIDTDTSMAYVLRIDYRGREFLGAPMRFAPGQDQIDWNVLLSEQAPPSGSLPDGHPPIPEAAPVGRPVVANPWHTILIALWIAFLFTGIAWLARRKVAAASASGAVDPAARSLARDIASLDARRAEGVIGPEEYQKVRAGLVEKLRTLARPGGSR
jgi:hypothetical protein